MGWQTYRLLSACVIHGLSYSPRWLTRWPLPFQTPVACWFGGFHVWWTDGTSYPATLWPSSHPWPHGSVCRVWLLRGWGGGYLNGFIWWCIHINKDVEQWGFADAPLVSREKDLMEIYQNNNLRITTCSWNGQTVLSTVHINGYAPNRLMSLAWCCWQFCPVRFTMHQKLTHFDPTIPTTVYNTEHIPNRSASVSEQVAWTVFTVGPKNS